MSSMHAQQDDWSVGQVDIQGMPSMADGGEDGPGHGAPDELGVTELMAMGEVGEDGPGHGDPDELGTTEQVAMAGDDGPDPEASGQTDVKFIVGRQSPHFWRVEVRIGDDPKPFHLDRFDVEKAGQRTKFIQALVKKPGAEKLDVKQLEDQLIQDVAAVPDEDGAASDPSYFAREEPEKPEEIGLYVDEAKGFRRLTNFVLRFLEDRQVKDEDVEGGSRVFRGQVNCLGVMTDIEMTHLEYSSRLLSCIYASAGPKAEFHAREDVLRAAISRISDPVKRVATTSIGWTNDGKAFLHPGGYVDAEGCHPHSPDCGHPEVVIPANEKARFVGFKALEPADLADLKAHVVGQLMHLHDRNVMLAMLGAAVLAPMYRFAGLQSRPVIWTKGITGVGKTYVARLILNFFGDFHSSGGERYVSWVSTGNSLQSQGFYFRDVPFLVDDYKPENTRHGEAVRLIQAYGDGTGRSRLNADATQNATRPIRGLLVSTGEDMIQTDSSGHGRTVQIPVPKVAQDYALGKACHDACGRYRGLMGDLISWAIREGRTEGFAAMVDHWRGRYLEAIAGRQNDGRIAANHAGLAAALQLFAEYMGDAWPGSAEEVKTFCEVYMVERVEEAAGAVESDLPASIFVECLRTLIASGQVRFQGQDPPSDDDRKEPDRLIGKIIREEYGNALEPRVYLGSMPIHPRSVIGISMSLALRKVQDLLRGLARPSLLVSNATLIQQLTSQGLILGKDHQPLVAGAKGDKSVVCDFYGKSKRFLPFHAGTFAEDSGPAPSGTLAKLTAGMAHAGHSPCMPQGLKGMKNKSQSPPDAGDLLLQMI